MAIHKVLANKSWYDPDYTYAPKEFGRSGGRSATATLTEEVVVKIRELYATGKYTQKKLGEMFGIGRSGICGIVTGRTWRHVIT